MGIKLYIQSLGVRGGRSGEEDFRGEAWRKEVKRGGGNEERPMEEEKRGRAGWCYTR